MTIITRAAVRMAGSAIEAARRTGGLLYVVRTGMFADGAQISSVPDAGGSGIDASQGVAGKRPTFAAPDGMLFDGVDDSLNFTPPPITTAATVVWSGKIADVTNRVLVGQSNTGLNLWVGGGKLWFGQIIGQDVNAAYSVPINTPIVISAQAESGGAWQIRVNGVQITSVSKTATFAGTGMGIMSQNGLNYWASGTCTLCYVNNKVISQSDLQAIERG